MSWRAARAEGAVLTDELDKTLHVSPLMGMDQTYAFRAERARRAAQRPHRVAPGATRCRHRDKTLHREAARPSTRPSRCAAASSAGPLLARMLARYPAMSLQVVAKIYAQSLRLKLKGARYFPHPEGRKPKGFLSP